MPPTPPTFLQGLSRVLNCSKVHVAATGLATTWLAVRYAAAGLPAPERAAMWVAFVGGVAVQLREIINAWTEEDVARVNAAANGSASPAPAEPSASPSFTAPATLPPVNLPIANEVAQLSQSLTDPKSLTPRRDSTMPARTKLPLVLLSLTFSAALLLVGGCASPPELTVYREGLHAVDEPLYQAHLLLLDDAVKASIRTDADRQTVAHGIDAARQLYTQSKQAEQPAK